MALCFTFALLLTGCDEYVEKAKYETLQKENADLKRQLSESQQSLRKAQEQVAQCQAHKYEIFHKGFRTWRLDTVTGSTCILLTTAEDWKKADTKLESCGNE
jgi:cell division septum initiation protein DivIVA